MQPKMSVTDHFVAAAALRYASIRNSSTMRVRLVVCSEYLSAENTAASGSVGSEGQSVSRSRQLTIIDGPTAGRVRTPAGPANPAAPGRQDGPPTMLHTPQLR